MIDPFGRTIDYLRISVTDRCNYRCVYCMPEEGMVFQPNERTLTADEIETVVRNAAKLGVRRVRLTGGEPLVRRDIVDIVRRVRDAGIPEISLTTNGQMLADLADDLQAAGLTRVNVSVDSLRPDLFAKIARGGDLVSVWRGIDAALDAGLSPVKINCVAMLGVNDAEAAGFAALTLDRPLHVRFIELMPIGGTHLKISSDRVLWQSHVGAAAPVRLKGCWENTTDTEVSLESDLLNALGVRSTAELFVPLSELRARIEELGPLEPAEVATAGPARNFRLPGAVGTIGFISQVSKTACATCNRMRVTPDGMLRPCLMDTGEVDLRAPLRAGVTDLTPYFLKALERKPYEHDLLNGHFADDRTMSQIGG